MTRKRLLVVTAASVVVLGLGALVTAVSYITSAGDQTLWSVRFMRRSGLEAFLARRARANTNKN